MNYKSGINDGRRQMFPADPENSINIVQQGEMDYRSKVLTDFEDRELQARLWRKAISLYSQEIGIAI